MDRPASRNSQSTQARVVLLVLVAALPQAGCARSNSGQEGWTWTWSDCEGEIYGSATEYAIRGKERWSGKFDTNIFELGFVPLTEIGYLMDVNNRTRFAIEFDWKQSLLVDNEGWTHPLVYPQGHLKPDSLQGTELPILIAPYAKRRIALVSPILLQGPLTLPFRPGPTTQGVRTFRPHVAPNHAELHEAILLTFRYQGHELQYRFTAKLTSKPPGDTRAPGLPSSNPTSAPKP